MKTLQEIKEFYEIDLRKELEQLQVKQKKKLRTARLLQGVFFCIAVLGFAFLYRFTENLLGSLIGTVFIYVFIFIWINSRLGKNLSCLHWNRIIQQSLHFIDKNLTYSAGEGISQKTFKDSQILLNKISSYDTSHLISGSIDGIKLSSSHIHAKEPSTRVPHTELFMGTFFSAKLNKTFSGRTALVPTNDIQVNNLGTVTRAIMRPVEKDIQSWPQKRDPVIKGHNPNFERSFVIYGNEANHTKSLLQRPLMQKIINYQTKTKKHLLFSFVDSQIFLACQHQFSSFDFSLSKPILEFETIQDYFEDLIFFMKIIDSIHSNTETIR